MRVGFLYQASGLFIASRCRRDNYKRELKKGKWREMWSKQEKFPRESLRLDSGQACSDTFPKIQELVLKENWITLCDPTLYSRRRNSQDASL
jgi:hypothetical protein